jgi:hypothetical protein
MSKMRFMFNVSLNNVSHLVPSPAFDNFSMHHAQTKNTNVLGIEIESALGIIYS